MSPVRFTVSSGSGPSEVRRFVRMLAAELGAELARRGAHVEHVVSHGPSEAPSSIDVVALAPPGTLADWLGTHALVMRSTEREKRARKRWYAAITVRPLAPAADVALRPEDVAFETCRAGGAGGQHVNRTESAVRALHRPSGLTVRVESERSQHQNRALALTRLTQALAERERERLAADVRERRLRSLHVERGRPVFTWTCDVQGALCRA